MKNQLKTFAQGKTVKTIGKQQAQKVQGKGINLGWYDQYGQPNGGETQAHGSLNTDWAAK